MEKEEVSSLLLETITSEDQLVAEIYFILKNDEENYLKFADITEEHQDELTNQFIKRINEDIIEDDEIDIINISSADERKKVIYEYDLDKTPDELNHMNKIMENEDLDYFYFNKDNLEDIRGILILIENNDNTLVLYKKHYPVSLYRKSSFSIKRLGSNKQRFTKLEDNILRINSKFQFFRLNDKLFIRDLKTLEKFFGFHKVIKNKAKKCFEKIKDNEILDNPKELEPMIDDITFARKLTKVISSSPVLGEVSKDIVVNFTQKHPALQGEFKYNKDNDKIKLDTKKSKKAFVKLLNDDFLVSELTEHYYDSLAKDRVDS